jgi:hypothetical protein
VSLPIAAGTEPTKSLNCSSRYLHTRTDTHTEHRISLSRTHTSPHARTHTHAHTHTDTHTHNASYADAATVPHTRERSAGQRNPAASRTVGSVVRHAQPSVSGPHPAHHKSRFVTQLHGIPQYTRHALKRRRRAERGRQRPAEFVVGQVHPPACRNDSNDGDEQPIVDFHAQPLAAKSAPQIVVTEDGRHGPRERV